MEYSKVSNNNVDSQWENPQESRYFIKDLASGDFSVTDRIVSENKDDLYNNIFYDFVNDVREYYMSYYDQDFEEEATLLESFFEKLITDRGHVIISNWLDDVIKMKSSDVEFIRGMTHLLSNVDTFLTKNFGSNIAFRLLYYKDNKVQENAVNLLEMFGKIENLSYLGDYKLTERWLDERVKKLLREYE